MTVRFRYEGQLIDWTRSHTNETIGGVKVPAWVCQRRHGEGGPDMFVKVAVRDGSPGCDTLVTPRHRSNALATCSRESLRS
jgi:hypothetical protein